ncbi:uncharacterized protein ACNLHF_022024 isoform 2-T2 [Anomaloglossus baeobatrachus]
MYEREALHQLRDRKCYKRLTFNLLTSFNNSLQLILDEALLYNTITKDQRHLLTVECPRVPCLYLLPKVHKDEKIPPGRPIVSGKGNFCEPLCKFLDWHLKPIVTTLPSFLIDSTDLLLRLEGITLEEDMWMVSLDVESLYTSIRHEDGLQAGTEGDLKKFVDYLNMNSLNIKLTSHHSQVSMDFLNLNIYRKMDNSLHTKIFRKPTAVNALLSAQSSHPQSLIKKTYQWDNSCDYGETVPRIRFSENKREN